MDFEDSTEEAQFRSRLRSWLGETLPTLFWPEPADLLARVPFWRQWQGLQRAADFAGLHWPKEYGGAAADPIIRAIYAEELDRAGAPQRLNTIGEDFAGPTIIQFGTDAQKSRYLEPILSGDEIWCQLFSEPDAGSDLASLRTRATQVEGGWRITGHKIWTSRAHVAAHAILLARTGGGPRHKGITYFLLPMDSTGITVRPLQHMLGDPEFNEVFLDEVFVPDDLVVGKVDDGWKVAMATLSFERVAIATGRVNTQQALYDIVDLVRRTEGTDGQSLGEDPLTRQKVADLYGRALMHHLTSQRILTSASAGAPPGPESSIGKLFFCALVEDLADFALSLHDMGGQFEVDESDQAERDRWVRLAYQARGTAIAGGTTFIQRNIVSERVLDMPRGR